MDTRVKTIQVTLPLADARFLRKQARGMGWTITTVPTSSKPADDEKIEMTEEEFRAKLARSSAQGAAGDYFEMGKDETAEQFINRILCTRSV